MTISTTKKSTWVKTGWQIVLGAVFAISLSLPVFSQPSSSTEPLLTVKQLMNAIITPTTAIIWGAYELQTDAEWLAIENAAFSLIAAGNLLVGGGAGEGEKAMAANADWQSYNTQMITAAQAVLSAVAAKDEAALSSAGNDLLYPPCESCHQQYQKR